MTVSTQHSAGSFLARIRQLLLTAVALWLLSVAPAVAAPPPAGTAISNQATASYEVVLPDNSVITSSALSNTVTTIVQPQEALLLSAAPSQLVRPGGIAVFAHRLTNTGNVTTDFSLSLVNQGGDSYDLGTLQLYRDLNGSGTIDAGDQLLNVGVAITLTAGSTVDLILTGTVPSPQPSGATALVLLTAASPAGTSASVQDAALVQPQPMVSIGLAATVTTLNPGDSSSLVISVANTGDAPAQPVAVNIDGTPATVVLIGANISLNSVFVNASLGGTAQLLLHRAGDPADSYLTSPPADPGLVDRIAFALPTLGIGQSVVPGYQIRFNASAGGTVSTATALVRSSDGTTASQATSNTVTFTLPDLPFDINYYTDATFNATTATGHLGSPLFVQSVAPGCNIDAGIAQTHSITLTSRLTSDQESFAAIETAPNSGIFRILPSVPTRDAAVSPVAVGNGIMELLKNDEVTATVSGCGSTVTATTVILIDPFGVVFDSRTNQPVAGVSLTLVDTATGNPATVMQADGMSPAANPVVTGADGRYEFPLVTAGTYRLHLIPPASHLFPSTVPIGELPAGRTIDPTGSYGGNFAITAATGPVRIDLPLDATAGGFFIQKTAGRTSVEIADFLDYTVRIRNAAVSTINGILLTDILPRGFAYLSGSARLDGVRLADPTGGAGPRLIFRIGSLAAGASAVLTYRVKVGPGALDGTGVNLAMAVADNGMVSNQASAAVLVTPGVFTDRGVIIGKVFLDCDRSRQQGDMELGIPGIRLYLEDGTFVVTDTEGKFSFYGISPRTHVLKLDETTLPAGAELEALDNRHAGDAASRFIDLKNGELHKANFALGACVAPVVRQVVERRLKGELYAAEINRAAEKLSLEQTAISDAKARPAGGMVGQPLPAPAPIPPSAGTAAPPQPRPAGLEDYGDRLSVLGPAIGFIEPGEGSVLGASQTTVRVKGPAGSSWRLVVNNRDVPEKRIGKRMLLDGAGIEAREYIGVDLQPGENRLELVQADGFGNDRERAAIAVIAPGRLDRIAVMVPPDPVPADGAGSIPVTIAMTDERGTPVASRTLITLESSLGRWQAADLDDREPGVQVAVEGGRGEFRLIAPAEPGAARVQVSAGTVSGSGSVVFVPELRPMLAAGVVEGVINLRRGDLGGIVPARRQDGFEEELRNTTFIGSDKRAEAGIRAALFLKGKIKGDYLLTLSYDSDKDTRERLFRDIQPDEFYPVYGDDSLRGFDAQSTSKLYVRIDKNRSYLLYGDLTTQGSSEVRQLGAYSRSLTGFKAHYESPLVAVTGFASDDSTHQVVEELPARGISGPYYLATRFQEVNSEKVELITRDRNQPSLVISQVPLTRFSDYEIDSFTGGFLFKAPVPSLDRNLNPNFIRVTYETIQGGRSFWVGGLDAQVKPIDRVEIGGVYVREDNPLDAYELMSANLTVKLLEKTYLMAEWARTDKDSVGTGDGQRIELRHELGGLQVRAYGAKTDTRFENPSSTIARGREEAGIKGRYRLSDSTALAAEAIYSADVATGGNRKGVLAGIEHSFGYGIKGELGMRHAHETVLPSQPGSGAAPPVDFTSIRSRLGIQVPFLPELGLFGEYEQAIAHGDQRIAALGGDYRLGPRSRAYARHEFISSLGSQYALNGIQQRNVTQVGLETEYMRDGTLFSEYRLRDSIDGRDSEAALGLRNLWSLGAGLNLSTSLEWITALQGPADNSSLAVTGGLEWTGSPLWKGSTRLEYRNDNTSNTWLNSIGLAHKLNRTTTLLGRHLLSITDGKGTTGDNLQERLQVGAAYRPVDSDRWNALGRYEFRYEDDSTTRLDLTRQVHILSATANFQPSRPLVTSARYAAKLAREESSVSSDTIFAHMLTGRATYDLSNKWDLGFNVSVLASGNSRSIAYGLGNEVGYLVDANLWFSAGINYFGFSDRDLSGEDYTAPGVFVRFRYKFDEHLFDQAPSSVAVATGTGR